MNEFFLDSQNTITVSFVFFLTLMLCIGLYAKKFSKPTSKDYLIASGDISVWQTVLSVLATTYSGFMYIGLIGYTYTRGISGIWLMLVWMLGEFFVIRFMPAKINDTTKKHNLTSYNCLLANYWGDNKIFIRKLSAVITLIFLSIYAAAQFNAAGKAINALLDWQQNIGIIGVYVMVLAYSFAGGIRASIWTDSVQFIIMLVSIITLVAITLSDIGGWGAFVQKLYQFPTSYTQLFPESVQGVFFISLFLAGWFFGGIGISGQPHVMVRYMAMRQTTKHKAIFRWYYSLAFVFGNMCVLSALLAKVYFADTLPPDFDPETTLPHLAMAIMPPVLVGLILSAILSSIISTADSQVLSCSASLGNDLLPTHDSERKNLWQNKIATVVVATFAVLIAIYGGSTVFALVIVAWSGLAASFAPLLLLQLMGNKIPQPLAITMMLSGLLATALWRIFSLNSISYEGLIGIVVGFTVFYITKPFTNPPADERL